MVLPVLVAGLVGTAIGGIIGALSNKDKNDMKTVIKKVVNNEVINETDINNIINVSSTIVKEAINQIVNEAGTEIIQSNTCVISDNTFTGTGKNSTLTLGGTQTNKIGNITITVQAVNDIQNVLQTELINQINQQCETLIQAFQELQSNTTATMDQLVESGAFDINDMLSSEQNTSEMNVEESINNKIKNIQKLNNQITQNIKNISITENKANQKCQNIINQFNSMNIIGKTVPDYETLNATCIQLNEALDVTLDCVLTNNFSTAIADAFELVGNQKTSTKTETGQKAVSTTETQQTQEVKSNNTASIISSIISFIVLIIGIVIFYMYSNTTGGKIALIGISIVILILSICSIYMYFKSD